MAITIINPPNICLNQTDYTFTVNGTGCGGASTGAVFFIALFGASSFTVKSSTGLSNIVVNNDDVTFNYTTAWSITIVADVSNAGLNPGDVFYIDTESSCSDNPTPSKIVAEACTKLPSDDGFSIPLFKCSCNTNTKSTIVSTGSFIFVKTANRLFKK